MLKLQKIAPCLWFDNQAEEAASFTPVSFIIPDYHISRYGEAGHEIHGRAAGTVMAVAFELEDTRLPPSTAARIIQVQRSDLVPGRLRTQKEIDHYWRSCPKAETKRRSNAAGSRTIRPFVASGACRLI